MTGRLADLNARIDTVHKLESVIKAMRGIAASRVQEAQASVTSVRTYAATIGHAIAEVLPLVPAPDDPRPNGPNHHGIIAFAAEQGFAGTYSDRVFEAVIAEAGPTTSLFVVGERGLAEAAERHLPVAWSTPMIAQPSQALGLANRIGDAIFDRLAAVQLTRVSVIHALPGGAHHGEMAIKRLIPFDTSRFPPPQSQAILDLTLPAADLLRDLIEEYVFAELAEAALLSFAAENEARMRAMIAAQDNTANTLAGMVATSRQLRQEEITEEIIELAMSSMVQT